MAGIPSLGPGPSFSLPGDAIPLDSVGEGSDESSNGDDIVVVDLSNKKLERQLVFTSVQSQDQQQTTVTEDGSKQADSQNTNVSNDSETAQEGAQEGGGEEDSAEDDGPPPTPPNLSALDNPFFTRPSRSGAGGVLPAPSPVAGLETQSFRAQAWAEQISPPQALAWVECSPVWGSGSTTVPSTCSAKRILQSPSHLQGLLNPDLRSQPSFRN